MANIKLKDLLNEQSIPNRPPIAQVGDNTRTVIPKQAVDAQKMNMQKGTSKYKEEAKAYEIAKKIYDAKGWIWDNEYDAVKAILSISDWKQYNLVQTTLQKLTGGRGIGQYVTGFIEKEQVSIQQWGKDQFKIQIDYLSRIIQHLTKIKAPANSIKFFSNALVDIQERQASIKRMQKIIDNQPRTTFIGGQLAWETAAIRSSKDPEFRHSYLMLLGMATSLIPVIGWATSAGIFSIDAADQYSQGNMRQAGLSGVFALIPIVGRGLNLIAKMPGVAKLGEKGMAELGRKMAMSGDPVLTALERVAIKDVWKYNYALKNGIDKYVKASLANQVTNSIVRDRIRQQLGQRGANVIFQIADGGLKASVLGAKIGIGNEALDYTIDTYRKLFNKYYAIPKMQANLKNLKEPDPNYMPFLEPDTTNYRNIIKNKKK